MAGDRAFPDKIAVFYIARGADADADGRFSRFRDSYLAWDAGIPHELHLIYKGFSGRADLEKARETFAALDHQEVVLPDNGFDLGAYFSAAVRTDADIICCLNTSSQILGTDWLRKLYDNLRQPGIGMVACSASYEAPQHAGETCEPFPNPHLRSNAFMIDRELFVSLRGNAVFDSKLAAHMFEHGPDGLSRKVARRGLGLLLVGRNGRGYTPGWWARSDTFRQGAQLNLLISDNQTKMFADAAVEEKKMLHRMAWGTGNLGQVLL